MKTKFNVFVSFYFLRIIIICNCVGMCHVWECFKTFFSKRCHEVTEELLYHYFLLVYLPYCPIYVIFRIEIFDHKNWPSFFI